MPQTGQFVSLNTTSIISDMWRQHSFSYLAHTSGSLTLEFYFQSSVRYYWYLDDVSVQGPSLTEMLTNGNFERASSSAGWTVECSWLCRLACGLVPGGYHTSNKCYRDACSLTTNSIRQSFVATASQLYNISFWIYLDHVSSILPTWANVEMNVIIT